MNQLHILVLDDEADLREEIIEWLAGNDAYHLVGTGSPSEALSILQNQSIDVVLLDINLPEQNGIALLKKIKQHYPNIEVIMITGYGDSDAILSALRYDAFDFFHKPLEAEVLEAAIQRTKKYVMLKYQMQRITEEKSLISKELEKDIGQIIGKSDHMKEVIDLTLRAANAPDTSVFICGPSGTGKELIARVIHYASPRKAHAFCTINCSAIPENLIESELFGYRKGAFTGAHEDRMGYFEAAKGGTLFMDEIGDMPRIAQTKILRVLEDRTIKRVGDRKEIDINVRIVSATNQDSPTMLRNQQFREDLYFRLNTIEITIPPLKEHPEDIPLLLEYFIHQYANQLHIRPLEIDQDVVDRLMTYEFPGNVRELQHLVERALILGQNADKLRMEHFRFPEAIPVTWNNTTQSSSYTLNLKELEKNALIEALEQTNYHQIKASKLLGISNKALSRKIKKFNILIRKQR